MNTFYKSSVNVVAAFYVSSDNDNDNDNDNDIVDTDIVEATFQNGMVIF